MHKNKIFFILLLSLLIFIISSQIAPIASAQSTTSGTISGMAWIDANSNNIQEPSEELASGVTIEVRTLDRRLAATVLTNAEGIYIITGLAYGVYHVNAVEKDGAATAEQIVELNEINGAATVDFAMKAPVIKFQFLPLVRR